MTNLRGFERQEFPQSVRKLAFKRCCDKDGKPRCEGCGNLVRSGGFIFEHIQADGLDGEPTLENCKVHCTVCKKKKDKVDNAIMAKADRVLKKTFGLKPKGKPMPGSKASGFKKKLSGEVVRR